MSGAVGFVARVQEFEKAKTHARKDFFDVTADFATEKWPTLFKTIYVGIDVAKELDVIPAEQQESFDNARRTFSLIKLARAPGEFLKNANQLRRSVSSFCETPSWGRGSDVFFSANDIVAPVWEGVDFGTKAIFNIPKDSSFVQSLKGVAGVSLVISMGRAAAKSMYTIATSKLSSAITTKEISKAFTEVSQALIDLIKSIACIALGVLTFLSVFFSIVAASYVFTALSAITVALSIISYYHQKLAINKEERKLN